MIDATIKQRLDEEYKLGGEPSHFNISPAAFSPHKKEQDPPISKPKGMLLR